MEEPKNTFRDEALKNKVSEQELLERDAFIEYLHRKTSKEISDMSCAHLQQAIDKLNTLGNKIHRLPDSPARNHYLKLINEGIKQMTEQKKMAAVNRAGLVLLSVLEERFKDVKDDSGN